MQKSIMLLEAHLSDCLLCMSRVLARSLAPLMIQVTGRKLMASFPVPRNLSQSVWITAVSIRSAASSEKPGDILTRTGMWLQSRM